MSKWKFKNKPLETPPVGVFGFVYKISWGKEYYIGQKSFWSTTNGKVSLKRSQELWSGKGPKPKRERKTKESNWKTYSSSSKIVQALIKEKGEKVFKFEILEFANTKTHLTLLEAKHIICSEALYDENCHNLWISLKVYKTRL